MATVERPTEVIPLTSDDSGTIRIGETRITLDVVIEAFRQGATPEQIAEQFPALTLPDIYAVVTWILRHQEEVADYVDRRNRQAAQLREAAESLCPPNGFRARLLARRAG